MILIFVYNVCFPVLMSLYIIIKYVPKAPSAIRISRCMVHIGIIKIISTEERSKITLGKILF